MRTTIMMALAILAVVPSTLATDRFIQRFGTDPINTRILKLQGVNVSEAIKMTNQGLLIELPVGAEGKGTQAGVATRFKAEGDFEITVGYQLVRHEQPNKGYGAGVVLRLAKMDGTLAGLSNRKRQNGKHVVDANLTTFVDEKPQHKKQSIETDADRGQLRVVRTGPTWQFLVADGDSQEFREVWNVDFGTDPIKVIQVVADTGGSNMPLIVRLTELSIRADGLPAGLPTMSRSTNWELWTIVSVLGVIVLIGSGVWYRRRRR